MNDRTYMSHDFWPQKKRRCAYLKIALKRLKIWKICAAIFCSSWNCASNEPNYKSIAIVVPKLHAVKVVRCLSEKTRKSQNLIVFKGLTWPKISLKISKKNPNFAIYLIFGPKTDKKTQFWENWNFSHLYINPLWTIGHICHTIFGRKKSAGALILK